MFDAFFGKEGLKSGITKRYYACFICEIMETKEKRNKHLRTKGHREARKQFEESTSDTVTFWRKKVLEDRRNIWKQNESFLLKKGIKKEEITAYCKVCDLEVLGYFGAHEKTVCHVWLEIYMSCPACNVSCKTVLDLINHLESEKHEKNA